MAQFCTECGAVVDPGKKFCVNCGAKIETAPVQAAQPVPAAPVSQAAQPQSASPVQQAYAQSAYTQPGYPETPQPAQGRYSDGAYPASAPGKVPGMLWYLGHLILLNIPLVGLVMSIVWGVKPVADSRRNLARAMIFINVIWLAAFVLFAVWEYSLLSQIAKMVDISFKIFGLDLFK